VVVHEDYAAGWKPSEAKRIVNAAITAGGARFDAVLATNDGTAGGAIQALLEEGLAGKVLVTGQDADLAACQRIVRGSQAMSVYKPLARLAERAAEVSVALARHRPVIARDGVPNGVKDVPSILEPVVLVDRDNLEATVVRDGFHRAEDLR
jgi:D-xylose transport system substrate-binding protein